MKLRGSKYGSTRTGAGEARGGASGSWKCHVMGGGPRSGFSQKEMRNEEGV